MRLEPFFYEDWRIMAQGSPTLSLFHPVTRDSDTTVP
jgi:hypothetical protein